MTDKLIGHKSNLISDQLHPVEILDENDPIFNSEMEEADCYYSVLEFNTTEAREGMHRVASYSGGERFGTPSLSFDEFGKKVHEMLNDFYLNYQCEAVSQDLKDANCYVFHSAFVTKALRSALDRRENDQKQISSLITVLYSLRILNKQHIVRGFDKLVQTIEDIKLDVPDAAEKVLAFIECSIDDECLDSDFQSRLPQNFLEASISAPSDFLDCSTLLDKLMVYKAEVREFLPDYFESGSNQDAESFLEQHPEKGLAHEFIRLLLQYSMEMKDNDRDRVSNLMNILLGKVISTDDVQFAFARLLGSIDDLKLDIPDICDLICKYLARFTVDEILPPVFLEDISNLHLGGPIGIQVMRKIKLWFSRNDGYATSGRFRKVWMCGQLNSEEYLQFLRDLEGILSEFWSKCNVFEATTNIVGLEMSPDEGNIFLKHVLTHFISLSNKERYYDCLRELLQALINQRELLSGAVSTCAQEVLLSNSSMLESIKRVIPIEFSIEAA